ncbi:hypothetical protein [Sphingobium sp. CECT 9361]|uniref:hypothetical protein n=1 Tax=Sphingobium sp. CECT 9361 TaxID=2845384 RepID=UPI001E554372|nr:hypothetical protein [Sphingobium sp. CECT 9361]CAH0357286.1 hypothetical protein SPH9361_04935 [Sphingobium sp. CECT 9361]
MTSSSLFWQGVGRTPYPTPALRWLRVYAFDPQASADLETATVNNSLIGLKWETPWERSLTPGPCGEYIEVIDHDPASGLFYEPVDLNQPALLAQNGLPPSEGRPQFHQQMVYAVAMKTIEAFERALGRTIFFAREIPFNVASGLDQRRTELVHRLRIYPHALREDNAYYSPGKTAILFGYFRPPTAVTSGDQWVFTCLSQDIIAHETTHAILHGVHRRSIQPSNLDTRAFHEGFADIVALMQHFTMRDVLRQQIAHTRGDMRRKSLLNSLAGQYGEALGRKRGALRVALELVEIEAEVAAAETEASRQAIVRKRWTAKGEAPLLSDPLDQKNWDALVARLRLDDSIIEPHERGGYLVAAVFDAFTTIYERRTADLIRLGLGARRRDEASALPPDLVERLAVEASKAADHVLRMCVRALDYVPPVDMTFGEYLRAIITADHDLVPDDPMCYRIAVAQAFRRRGIVPENSLSMAPDSLLWDAPNPDHLPPAEGPGHARHDLLFADLLSKIKYAIDYKKLLESDDVNFREWNAKIINKNRYEAWRWFSKKSDEDDLWAQLIGVEMMAADDPKRRIPGESEQLPLRSVGWEAYDGGPEMPVIQLYSIRVARRAGPDGQELSQLVVQIVQRRRAYFDEDVQQRVDKDGDDEATKQPDFWFRGGATLLVDLRDGRLRYAIRKTITDEKRLARQRTFERDRRLGFIPMAQASDVYGLPADETEREPFAFVHRGMA